MSGRNKCSYRAFCVKQLAPPHHTTFYLITEAATDANMLAKLGLDLNKCTPAEKKSVAQAAVMRHKSVQPCRKTP